MPDNLEITAAELARTLPSPVIALLGYDLLTVSSVAVACLVAMMLPASVPGCGGPEQDC